LDVKIFSGDWDEMPDFSRMSPRETRAVQSVSEKPESEYQGREYLGYIYAQRDEMHIFGLTSDDGSRLYIGDKLVVDNDGLHGIQVKTGSIALAEGWHPIRIEWFNKTGGASLNLQMGLLGEEMGEIDSEHFATKRSDW